MELASDAQYQINWSSIRLVMGQNAHFSLDTAPALGAICTRFRGEPLDSAQRVIGSRPSWRLKWQLCDATIRGFSVSWRAFFSPSSLVVPFSKRRTRKAPSLAA